MKKIFIFALLCFCSAACDNKEQATPQEASQATSISYRQLASVPVPDGSLKVDLKDVSDSRCPINADCIWAGDAKLLFSVSEGSDSTEVTVNFTGNVKTDNHTFVLGGQKYILRVSSVLPYPETSASPVLQDYKVEVTIEKL